LILFALAAKFGWFDHIKKHISTQVALLAEILIDRFQMRLHLLAFALWERNWHSSASNLLLVDHVIWVGDEPTSLTCDIVFSEQGLRCDRASRSCLRPCFVKNNTRLDVVDCLESGSELTFGWTVTQQFVLNSCTKVDVATSEGIKLLV